MFRYNKQIVIKNKQMKGKVNGRRKRKSWQ